MKLWIVKYYQGIKTRSIHEFLDSLLEILECLIGQMYMAFFMSDL